MSQAASESGRHPLNSPSGRDAQCTLGSYYARGVGVAKSKEKAFELYLRAAEGRSDTGCLAVGLALMKGDGVAKDIRRARSWVKRVADKGDKEAMQMLAAMMLIPDQ